MEAENGPAYGESVLAVSDGYVITGSVYVPAIWSMMAFLIKTDFDGNEVWSNTFGNEGAFTNQGSSVAAVSDGYVITGQTYDNGSPAIYLVKTDLDGNLLWQRTFFGSIGSSVAAVSDGYVISGVTDSDICLIKTDLNGNMLWNRSYGGSGVDFGHSIATAPDGYIIAGRHCDANYDIYLIKTAPNGDLIWQKTYGKSSNLDEGFSVMTLADGYLVTGWSASYSTGNSMDAYLLKTDFDGNEIWHRAFGGPWQETGKSIAVAPDGFVIAGYTQSIMNGPPDIYLVKVGFDDELPVSQHSANGTPINGWYTALTKVTFTASDTGGSGMNSIKYRKNNGTLQSVTGSTASTYLTNGSNINGTFMIEYYAVDNAENAETPHTICVKVDTVAPTTTVSPSGGSGIWYNNPRAILSATDYDSGVATVNYYIDSGATQQYAGNDIAVTMPEGTHRLYYWSTDNVGKVETTRNTLFNIDTVAPVTTISLSGTMGSNGWYTGNVQVTLNRNDAASGVSATRYTLDGVTNTYTGPFNVGGGNHTLSCWSRDVAGNDETQHTVNICVDANAPVTTGTIVSSSSGPIWYNAPVSVSLTATDAGSGVASIGYVIGSGTIQQYAGDNKMVPMPEGTHTLTWWSNDNAGNRESNKSLTIRVDTVAPVTAIALSGTMGTNGWNTSTVMVTLAGSDAASWISSTYYVLDGVAYTYGSPFSVVNGMHTLSCWSTDAAGNNETPSFIDVNVDTVAPVTAASPAGGSGTWLNNSHVSLSATDGGSGVAYINYMVSVGTLLRYNGTSTTVTLPDGTNTLYYRSVDNAGKSESLHSGQYKIDTIAPTTAAGLSGAMGSNGWYTSGVRVTLAGSDATSGVAMTQYALDGITQDYSSPFNVSEGGHTLSFWSTDNAGNTEITHALTVNVDTMAPAMTEPVLTGALDSNGHYASDVTVALYARDDLSGVGNISYSLDNATWTIYTGPFAITSNGNNTVYYYYSTDIAGNTGAVQSRSVQINKNTANLFYTLSGRRSTYGEFTSDVTVDFSPSVNVILTYIQYSMDGNTWTNYSAPIVVPYRHSPIYYRILIGPDNVISGSIPLSFYLFSPVMTPAPAPVSVSASPAPTPVSAPESYPVSTPVPSPTYASNQKDADGESKVPLSPLLSFYLGLLSIDIACAVTITIRMVTRYFLKSHC